MANKLTKKCARSVSEKLLVEIDYADKKCPECGAWAFIPALVTDVCQECWEEQKYVQYFYSWEKRNEEQFRFTLK